MDGLVMDYEINALEDEESAAAGNNEDEDIGEREQARFWCNHCVSSILPNKPIYMRNDYMYCSPTCREKGISKKYKLFVESVISTHSEWSEGSSHFNEDGVGVFNMGKKVLDKVMRKVSSSLWGDKILRSYSTSLVWGKSMTKNSSFNFLFTYFPEIDTYLEENGDAVFASRSNSSVASRFGSKSNNSVAKSVSNLEAAGIVDPVM